MQLPTRIPPDVCYRALLSRDARFDGCFFVGVSSTGIYCRPVCRVKAPKRENCTFFDLAAQAEQAGYRPCLRCRPEMAPGAWVWSLHDATRVLALQAAQLLDAPEAWSHDTPITVRHLAARLGVSERHLRRIFEAQWGLSPLQYLQTRRLLTAKQLLTDTPLPIAHVALASGFGSVRRFNAVFAQHYRLQPQQVRRNATPARADTTLLPAEAAATTVCLGYRPPYDVPAMLGFLAARALPGLEHITLNPPQATRSLQLESADGHTHTGWVQARFDPAQLQVRLRVCDSLLGMLPTVIRRVRAWLDLDADPTSINAVLGQDFPGLDGLRVPGCVDGFELAVRAVLGQQITVAAARTLGTRLLERFGAPLPTPWPQVRRIFASPATLAKADGDVLGQIGIVKSRQAAIVALARACCAQGSNRLLLHPGADVHAATQTLRELPGIGDWTAQYIAMRALRWPDAFPAGDVALHQRMGLDRSQSPQRIAAQAEIASQVWKPWRSYAVIRIWAACGGPPTPKTIAPTHLPPL